MAKTETAAAGASKLLNITPIWFPLTTQTCVACGMTMTGGKTRRFLLDNHGHLDDGDVGIARFRYRWLKDGRHVDQYLCGICTIIETNRDAAHRLPLRSMEFDRNKMASHNKKTFQAVVKLAWELETRYREMQERGEKPEESRGWALMTSMLPDELTTKIKENVGMATKTKTEAELKRAAEKKARTVAKLKNSIRRILEETEDALKHLLITQIQLHVATVQIRDEEEFKQCYENMVAARKTVEECVARIEKEVEK